MSLAEIYDLPETLPERFNLPLARSKLDRVKLEYDCIDDLSTIDGKITGIDYGFKNRTIKEAKLMGMGEPFLHPQWILFVRCLKKYFQIVK